MPEPEDDATHPPAHGDTSTESPRDALPALPNGGGPTPTQAWVGELGLKVRNFVERRGLRASAVKVTLADGEWFYVDSVEPGPGEGFISFSAYPPPAEMEVRMVPVTVEVDGEERRTFMTPRVVIVRVDTIRKLELLSDPPQDHPVGFTVRTDLVRASATPGAVGPAPAARATQEP